MGVFVFMFRLTDVELACATLQVDTTMYEKCLIKNEYLGHENENTSSAGNIYREQLKTQVSISIIIA